MGNSEQLAYAAGLIDGDGSINLSSVEKEGGYRSFILNLYVRMINYHALHRLVGTLGGTVIPDSQQGLWKYIVTGKKAASVCQRISRFLAGKKAQAELAVQFQEHMDKYRHFNRRNPTGYGTHGLPSSIIDERLQMCSRMKSLHLPDAGLEITDVGISLAELYAYGAGLVDAEGSITVIKSGRGMLPAVLMQMTDLAPLQRMVRVFGGHVHEETRRTKRGKIVYSWRLTSGNASATCQSMLPYLIVKREQAEIVIRFQNNVLLWQRRLGFGSKNIPEDVRSKRFGWIEQVRSLNSHRKLAAAETKSEYSDKEKR